MEGVNPEESANATASGTKASDTVTPLRTSRPTLPKSSFLSWDISTPQTPCPASTSNRVFDPLPGDSRLAASADSEEALSAAAHVKSWECMAPTLPKDGQCA